MASVLQFVIVSVLAAHLCHAQLSQHDTTVLTDFVTQVNDAVSNTCKKEVDNVLSTNGSYDTDAKIDNLCDDIKQSKFGFKMCKTSEQTDVQKIACKIILASSNDRGQRMLQFGKKYNQLSKPCKDTVKIADLTTWFNIEQLCKKMVADKAVYEKKCPKGEYDTVHDGLACGRAPVLVSGLLAIGMSLAAALYFNKL